MSTMKLEVSERITAHCKEWTALERPPKPVAKTGPRARPENVKQRIVTEKGYKDLRLKSEAVAEFEHQPLKRSEARS